MTPRTKRQKLNHTASHSQTVNIDALTQENPLVLLARQKCFIRITNANDDLIQPHLETSLHKREGYYPFKGLIQLNPNEWHVTFTLACKAHILILRGEHLMKEIPVVTEGYKPGIGTASVTIEYDASECKLNSHHVEHHHLYGPCHLTYARHQPQPNQTLRCPKEKPLPAWQAVPEGSWSYIAAATPVQAATSVPQYSVEDESGNGDDFPRSEIEQPFGDLVFGSDWNFGTVSTAPNSDRGN